MRHFSIITLTLLGILLAKPSMAQLNYQEEYLNAKSLLRAEQYEQARYGFAKLLEPSENNPFSLYAQYFYAIAAYKSQDTTAALEKLRRLRITHSKWDKMQDANLWYGKMLLETGELLKGIQVLNEVKSKELIPIAVKIKKANLLRYNEVGPLKEALELNPYDSIIAKRLANVINEVDLIDRPVELQEFLVSSFNLDGDLLGVIDKEASQMKQTYNVGVMMPFMVNDLTTSKGSKANQFILDIYQGIKVAVDELNAKGEKIKLFVFDTKRDSLTTQRILDSGDLLEMDLLIGPLYPDPVKLVQTYSKEHRINMVNPLSTNSTVIGDNPYSFLLKSTPETRALKAAQYAASHFDTKRATIFYGEGEQDSIYAYAYKKYLEQDSFKVNWIAPVRSSVASTEVLRALTEVFETDTLNYGKVYISNTKKVRVEEGDSLIMSKDSIGHIMVASEKDKLLIFNILSAVQTRRDSIPIIGMESWIDFDQISYPQLERLKVTLVGQNYFDYGAEKLAEFKDAYREKFNKVPSQFSYNGYESMRFFGEQLINYGNYFQYGLSQEGFQNGYLYSGFDYSNANDNQYVPLLRLKDLDLLILPTKEKTTDSTY